MTKHQNCKETFFHCLKAIQEKKQNKRNITQTKPRSKQQGGNIHHENKTKTTK